MNIHFVLRTFGLTLLATLSLPALPQESAGPSTAEAQEVPFVFGWKPGLKIRVHYKSAQETPGKSRQSAVSYTMAVDAAGERLAIRFQDPKLAGALPAANAGAQAFQEQFATAIFPEILVTKSGQYAGLFDPVEQSSRVRLLLDKLVAEKVTGPARIGINNALDMFSSPAFLQSKAGDMWNPIVGTWIGARLEVGEDYAFEQTAPFPLLPGAQIKMKGTFSVVETHTCLRGGIERLCAGVQMITESDPQNVARVVEELIARANTTGKPAPKVDTLSVKTELTLVTEPDGLFPHEYVATREMHLSLTTNGKTEKADRIDLQEAKYTY